MQDLKLDLSRKITEPRIILLAPKVESEIIHIPVETPNSAPKEKTFPCEKRSCSFRF